MPNSLKNSHGRCGSAKSLNFTECLANKDFGLPVSTNVFCLSCPTIHSLSNKEIHSVSNRKVRVMNSIYYRSLSYFGFLFISLANTELRSAIHFMLIYKNFIQCVCKVSLILPSKNVSVKILLFLPELIQN